MNIQVIREWVRGSPVDVATVAHSGGLDRAMAPIGAPEALRLWPCPNR